MACKVGSIEVNVYEHYSLEALENFALTNGITLSRAESLAREQLYRAEYARRASKLPSAIAARKTASKKRSELRMLLSRTAAVPVRSTNDTDTGL
jgi:hypothetical protein